MVRRGTLGRTALPDTPMTTRSPFLAVPPADRILDRDLVFAIWDGFPVTPGHALVVPKRVVPTWFDADRDERIAIMDALDAVRAIIDERYQPDGYTIGVNVGEAAGQTVPHLHVHVIPRRAGDIADPTGGVRGVIPGQANYHDGSYRRPPAARTAD